MYVDVDVDVSMSIMMNTRLHVRHSKRHKTLRRRFWLLDDSKSARQSQIGEQLIVRQLPQRGTMRKAHCLHACGERDGRRGACSREAPAPALQWYSPPLHSSALPWTPSGRRSEVPADLWRWRKTTQPPRASGVAHDAAPSVVVFA